MLRDWKSTMFEKKSVFKRIKKPKKPLNHKKLLKKQRFLYQSRKVLLKYRTFLHRYHDCVRGLSNDYAIEPLYSQAYFQRRALSQRNNHSQRIRFSYIPQPAIEYSTRPNQILQ